MSAGSERLERTRLAILEHIHRKELRRHGHEPSAARPGPDDGDPHAQQQRRGRRREPGGWIDQASEALQDWWRYHPAHMAVDVARPALAAYARRKPMQYLGLAALAGAAVFALRPWKLISATGMLVAVLKSPQVASMLISALSSAENPSDDHAPDDE